VKIMIGGFPIAVTEAGVVNSMESASAGSIRSLLVFTSGSVGFHRGFTRRRDEDRRPGVGDRVR
jgi:hypothetical protein